jgi:anaerobic selenocysteine-containing dehydrogenase
MDAALALVASELTRVKDTYGPSAVFNPSSGHSWDGNLHSIGSNQIKEGDNLSGGWANRFFSCLGGCTVLEESASYPGWWSGGAVIAGSASFVTNNVADILANTKLLIHWGANPAVGFYNNNRQNIYLKQMKDAGITQIVIDPRLNETMMLYGDQCGYQSFPVQTKRLWPPLRMCG